MIKKILSLVIIGTLCSSIALGAAFKDLPASHWAYPYVMKLVEDYKILSGYPDNTFKGERTLNRYEFSKALVSTLTYIESKRWVNLKADSEKEVAFKDVKTSHWAYTYLTELVSKYQIISGYPDGTFQGARTLNKSEVTVAVAKALARVEKATRKKIELKDIKLNDLPKSHWAYPSAQKLISAGILSDTKTFSPKQPVSRYNLSVILVNFIQVAVEGKIKGEEKKVERKPIKAGELIKKSLAISSEPLKYVSVSAGNVYESASATNNWMSLGLAAGYTNVFDIMDYSGNYEISARYNYNQINYITPTINGLVDEHRFDVEANTVHPLVNFYGIDGKLLVGLKYLNLSNPTAPTDFTGLNLGLVTTAIVENRTLLTKAFYSYPLTKAMLSTSALGQPTHLIDYEVSIDGVLMDEPVLIGLTGELMYFSNSSTPRMYNSIFVRYFIQ